ncbi:MAG: hypothetical protein ACHQXA_02975 [Gemmatimonadales bacterium]
MGPLGTQGNLIQFVAIVGMLVIAARAMRYIGPAIAKRLGGDVEGGRRDQALQAEVDELRARVAELEQERGHLAELEERLDFAERMLTQKQDVRELPAGGGLK